MADQTLFAHPWHVWSSLTSIFTFKYQHILKTMPKIP